MISEFSGIELKFSVGTVEILWKCYENTVEIQWKYSHLSSIEAACPLFLRQPC